MFNYLLGRYLPPFQRKGDVMDEDAKTFFYFESKSSNLKRKQKTIASQKRRLCKKQNKECIFNTLISFIINRGEGFKLHLESTMESKTRIKAHEDLQ